MFNFNKSSKGKTANGEKPRNSSRGMAWQIPVFFGIIFALSVAELVFTIDAFVYLEKKDKWWSKTEKARMAFLIFSSARSILLSATYVAVNFIPMKNIMSTLHVVCLPLPLLHPACLWRPNTTARSSSSSQPSSGSSRAS